MAKQKNKRRKNRKPPKRRPLIPTAAATGRRPIRLRPLRWEGEPAEDQAVFDDQSLAGLTPDRSAEVLAVRESLQLLADSSDDASIERLSDIPRRSPLSDWRILVRGLVDWYAERFEAAAEIWRRLDSQRRPSRIAQALLTARREDLADLSASTDEPSLDSSLLAAARRVRKTWIDRPALGEASRCIGFAETSPARATDPPVHLSTAQLNGLLEFSRKYGDVEPSLVASLQQAALERAFLQPYADLFERTRKSLAGPAHDPANLLLQFHYHSQFEDSGEDCQFALKQYLSTSLPKNQQLSPELGAALRSRICLLQTRIILLEQSAVGLMNFFRRPPIDTKKVESLFKESIQAYPANAKAHQAYVAWIRSMLDDEYLDSATHKRFESTLRFAMEQWSQGLPEEIEPRLWLVDEYLNEEALELAEPHVQWLSQSRHPDPRVRIIPWKWQMLEAMRLSRRKTWLPQAVDKLDAAEAQWPPWLGKTWLPYLRAALTLRSGKRKAFEQQRAEIREADRTRQPPVSELADAVMMLAAAQRMRVPAADLKPLRAPVDAAVANLPNLSIPELVSAGSFFWDLHRIQMLYPAYRMHGKKFAIALKDLLQNTRKLDPEWMTPPLWDALFWISERELWSTGQSLPLPACLNRFAGDVRHAAATALFLLSLRRTSWLDESPPISTALRTAAATEQDVYYRYWYSSLAQRIEERFAESERRREMYRSMPFFSSPFDDDEDDDDEDDYWDDEDEDQDDFDPHCDCEHCTATRERLGIPHPASQQSTDSTFDDESDDKESDRDDDWFGGFVPPTPRPKPTEIPLDPEFRRKRPKNPLAKKRKKNKK